MNWLLKIAAFKILSGVPKGAALYRYSQERITGSLVPTRARVGGKVEVALQYWNWLKDNHHSNNQAIGPLLDFGAGWHPTIPLMFYALGVERQYLCDLKPILNGELISQTVDTVRSIITDAQWPHRASLKRLPEPYHASALPWDEYLKKMGITYHAPYESKMQEIDGTLEAVISTQVFVHIPRDVLRACFDRIKRNLKKGGKFLATIHLIDLHATAKNGLSQYNKLRYSPGVWEKWINSSLMSYNRLHAADYRELLEETGFKICHFDVTGPTASDLKELDSIPVHECFQRYSREELGAKHLFFVAEKP